MLELYNTHTVLKLSENKTLLNVSDTFIINQKSASPSLSWLLLYRLKYVADDVGP